MNSNLDIIAEYVLADLRGNKEIYSKEEIYNEDVVGWFAEFIDGEFEDYECLRISTSEEDFYFFFGRRDIEEEEICIEVYFDSKHAVSDVVIVDMR